MHHAAIYFTFTFSLSLIAPPVDTGFETDCMMQKMGAKHIECAADGSFAAVQCMGPMCFCVDTGTGERLNAVTFSKRESEDVNCSAGMRCSVHVSSCSKMMQKLLQYAFHHTIPIA